MAELTVEDLHLTYGTHPILKRVPMVLNRGEGVSLLGRAGPPPPGPPAPALRRAAAARDDPPPVRSPPPRHRAGRAALEPRREAARGGARVAARADRRDATLRPRRHARPERGDGDVGPDPAPQQRRDRAAGRPAGEGRPAAHPLRSGLQGTQQPAEAP